MTAEKFADISKSFINTLLSPFYDENQFSWRKGMTAVVTFVFAYACIGFLNKNNFVVLPQQYIWIIVLIFVAYFGKDIPQGFIDLGSKYLDFKIEKQKQITASVVNGETKQ